jgi:hypothetical protein
VLDEFGAVSAVADALDPDQVADAVGRAADFIRVKPRNRPDRAGPFTSEGHVSITPGGQLRTPRKQQEPSPDR